ncbi:MAG TPA: hypothetical protein VH092_16725 [Urbifossiella sp.]|nr:hypothetical protein [Urbifossiella sp.]
MPSTAADILLDRLIEWDIDTIFSLPGMPGHVTTRQALQFAEALARGEKDGGRSSRRSSRTKSAKSSDRPAAAAGRPRRPVRPYPPSRG